MKISGINWFVSSLIGSTFAVLGQFTGAYVNGNEPDIGVSVGLVLGYMLGSFTMWRWRNTND